MTKAGGREIVISILTLNEQLLHWSFTDAGRDFDEYLSAR